MHTIQSMESNWNLRNWALWRLILGCFCLIKSTIKFSKMRKSCKFLMFIKTSAQGRVPCTSTPFPTLHKSVASSLKGLTELSSGNEILNMTSSMLASTTAVFLQNKQQCAEYLRTVAYSLKTTFHQKWPFDTSIFTFLNVKWCICSHPLLLQKKMLMPNSPKAKGGVLIYFKILFSNEGRFCSSG